VAKKRERIREDQLRNWNLLDQFRQRVLPRLQAKAAAVTEQDEWRTLFAEDYFCSYLFAVLNFSRSLSGPCFALKNPP
jgi:hypothetical protein